MHIVASLPSDPDLARYYRVDWQVIPNLAMDLIVPPLSTLIGLNAAGQVFLTAIFGLIAIGMMLLGRSLFGRWSAAPLFGLPFLYNGMLLIGCLNYLLGVGLALCALAAWVALETKSLWIKLGLAGAMVIPLFFCHLYSVGLFGVGLLAFELLKQSNARRWTWARRAREFFVPAIAFLPVLPLLLASPTADLSGNIIWDMHDKSSGFTLALVTYSGWIGAVLFAALVVAAFLAVWLGLLSAHPVTPFLLFTGITIYFLMPRELFDTCMTDQRMPIALLFMLLATIDLRLPKQAWGAVIGIAAVFLGIRVCRDKFPLAYRGERNCRCAEPIHAAPPQRQSIGRNSGPNSGLYCRRFWACPRRIASKRFAVGVDDTNICSFWQADIASERCL